MSSNHRNIYPYEKDGKHVWRVQIGRRVDGKLVRKSAIVEGNITQAKAVRDRFIRELTDIKAGLVVPRTVTFKDIVDSFLEYADLAKRSANKDHQRAVPLLEFFGPKTVARSITYNDVVRYVTQRRKTKSSTGKIYAPGTIDRELALLKSIFSHACKNMLLDPPYNPAQYVPLAKVGNMRDTLITTEQLKALLDHSSIMLTRLIFVARFTGLRKEHLKSLDWSQIDQEKGLILPPQEKEFSYLRTSSKQFGVVPIPDGMLDILPTKPQTKGPVWQYRNKKPVKSIRSSWVRARTKAKLDDAWFHDLRRAYATQLLTLAPDQVRKTILGHAISGASNQVHERYLVVQEKDILDIGKKISESEEYKSLFTYTSHAIISTSNLKKIIRCL